MNKYFKFYIALFLVGVIHAHYLLGQEITFQKVAPPPGNFAGFVGGVAQDKYGFIWVAGKGGLYRYDGYQYKKYTPPGIVDFRLETIYIDREGIIWLPSWLGGLFRFDPVGDTFIHFTHDSKDTNSLPQGYVRDVLEDHEGTVWIGTYSGLARYDKTKNTFFSYTHDPKDPSSLSSNIVRKIYEDKQHRLWIGTGSVWVGEGGETDGGLNLFDPKTNKFIRFTHEPANPNSLISNKVQAIFEDSRGVFWVGTAGDGLHSLDRETGKFTRYPYYPAHPDALSRPPLINTAFPDHITFINEDRLGKIWIGTLGNGVVRYDHISGKTIHYSATNALSGFNETSAYFAFNAKDGTLFISTFDGQLYRVDPLHKKIPFKDLSSIVTGFGEDKANNLWIGTDKGLIVINEDKGTTKKYTHHPDQLSSLIDNNIQSILITSQGIPWIGTLHGLDKFNEKSGSFVHYFHKLDDTNSLGANTVYAIAEDKDYLWVGTGNGLDLMDTRTGKFRHFRNEANDSTSIGSNQIYTLFTDSLDRLWIGNWTFGGLNYYNPLTATFSRFFKNNSIINIDQETGGKLWVAADNGLYFSQDPFNGFSKFVLKENPGLTENIYNIILDNQNSIWLTSQAGLFRINPYSNQYTEYGEPYGVTISGIPFGGSNFKSAKGIIYIGNKTGYYRINPDQNQEKTHPPDIAITDFRISGNSLVPGKSSPSKEPIENLQSITLNYDQNVISIQFAGLHYTNPIANRHQYMLENYDSEWRTAGNDKTAHYVNLPPGHYTFKMKAANNDGDWTERSLAIYIKSPWWKTWWAYVAYGALLFILVYAMYRFQKNRIILAEREKTTLLEIEHAREIEKAYQQLGQSHETLKATQAQLIQSEKMASLGELTAGIAHEIQNPLNFVNNFSEVNAELIDELEKEVDKGNYDEVKVIAKDIKDNEQKINHHGKRADAIVKGMLQHSKTSSGKKEPTDINTLADEYLRLAYQGLRSKDKSLSFGQAGFNATMKTDFDETIGNINIIPQDIGRVLLNLYNNAFYAVNEKFKLYGTAAVNERNVEVVKHKSGEVYTPTVSVSTKKTGDTIEIKVADNGNGIPDNIKDKIFQPFFTTKPSGQGTGLGLSLAYDIIKAHGGTININSNNEGSTFQILLPIQ